ncbi:MAG: T9SS type A sorting domain-containing protein [Bacteroidia bacterium]
MKKSFYSFLLLIACLILPTRAAFAQVCTIDSSYSSPGIYPNDTLPDMTQNVGYSTVVQFVFPIDTTLFGFTMNFDSFIVLNVPTIPNITWQCDRYQDSCHYVTQPPQLTRGCVALTGIPAQMNPAYPGYDSILVAGQAWVTVPFIGPTPVNIDIPIYYRVGDSTSAVDPRTPLNLGLAVHPNPVSQQATLEYTLRSASQVSVEVYDMLGQRQAFIPARKLSAGKHSANLPVNALPAGLYFVKVDLGGGRFDVEKFLKVDW